jgi:hypothetical protein
MQNNAPRSSAATAPVLVVPGQVRQETGPACRKILCKFRRLAIYFPFKTGFPLCRKML